MKQLALLTAAVLLISADPAYASSDEITMTWDDRPLEQCAGQVNPSGEFAIDSVRYTIGVEDAVYLNSDGQPSKRASDVARTRAGAAPHGVGHYCLAIKRGAKVTIRNVNNALVIRVDNPSGKDFEALLVST